MVSSSPLYAAYRLQLMLWGVLTSVHSLVWGYETSLYDYLKVEQHYIGDYNGILASSGLLLGNSFPLHTQRVAGYRCSQRDAI